MKLSVARPFILLTSLLATLAAGQQVLRSSSLNTCQANSQFTASLFDVVFTTNNDSASVNIIAVSSVSGYALFDVQISAYGYNIISTVINPCTAGFAGLCPMTAGDLPLSFNLPVSPSDVAQIPSIAYSFPDLDATVRVLINITSGPQTGQTVACVEADISNGKTVDLLGVKWATAIVAGLALASSAIVSGLGHTNAASHVASNALSLFGYFQAQAMVGLTAVPLPPVVQSWTQDFQWTMGIIEIGFMQDIFTWYQRATGGTPSTIFNSLTTVSVQVEKRSMDFSGATLGLLRRSAAMMPRAVAQTAGKILKRANITTSAGSYIVYGIQRVAFRAYIESTNLFMTGLVFFCLFVVLTAISVVAFKGFCELAVRQKWMQSDKFVEFRNGWRTVLKGILFRLTLIGYPQMTILCLWELTQRDSAAEVVLAVFFFVGMTITLGWAAFKVIRIARRSVAMHRNPAYILFSDPQALNKWGFLYVQFRASAYYYIVPLLAYTLIKSMFVAFAQPSGTTQAVAFIVIEVVALIAASVLRPWMDKSTNSFNIAIISMNLLNAIFLLIFTDVFNQPALVTGVVGVVFWIANAVFALVLLIMLIVTTVLVLFRKNPDTRYQFMADDRASFMKSQTQLTTTTELDALAATARGDKAGGYGKVGLDLDDDAESISSDSLRRQAEPARMNMAPSAADAPHYQDIPRSPVSPSMPLFPADGAGGGNGGGGYLRNQPSSGNMGSNRSPSPYNGSVSNLSNGYRSQHNASPAGFRQQNNASPAGFRSQNNAR